MGFSTRT